jgi:hypothetical protein
VRDDAAGPLTATSGLGGSFQPTDLDDGAADAFPPPAPAGPHATTLRALAGPGANGVWSLYAVDDTAGDTGTIASWQLEIRSRDPLTVGAHVEGVVPGGGFPEGVGTVHVHVQRTAAPGLDAGSLAYSTAPFFNSPIAGADYIPQAGRLAWAAGEASTKTIDVAILEDAEPEPQESLVVSFTDPAGDLGIPRNPYQFLIAIADNEPLVLPPEPRAVLRGRRVQRVLRQRGVVVSASSNVTAMATATGTITVPGGAAAALRLRAASRRVRAGRPGRLKLRLSRRGIRTVRRALVRRRALRATVRLTLEDGLGRTDTTTKRLRLTR